MAVTAIDQPEGAIDALGDNIGFVALVDRMAQDPALKVVNSARISYDKQKEGFDERDKKLCSFLWEHGHTSPYRHSFYTFHWKAPLFVFRQAFKYQVGSGWRTYEVEGEEVSLEVFDMMFDTDKGCSWNEVSEPLRQVDAEFYVERDAEPTPRQQAGVRRSAGGLRSRGRARGDAGRVPRGLRALRARIERGVAKEIARMILPQSLYSQAYWTVSLQGVLHFLDQRLKPDAQYEIRAFARAIAELVKDDLERIGVTLDD